MSPMDEVQALPILPALTIPPDTSPAEAKSLITQAINILVPPDKHVTVVSGFARSADGTLTERFASAQRIGTHLQFHEEFAFASRSSGNAWEGEVSLVGVW